MRRCLMPNNTLISPTNSLYIFMCFSSPLSRNHHSPAMRGIFIAFLYCACFPRPGPWSPGHRHFGEHLHSLFAQPNPRHLTAGQGWGLLNQFSPFRYFPIFLGLPKHTLAVEYHVHTWQVSPQLSCGDICQIWSSYLTGVAAAQLRWHLSNMNVIEII